MASSAQMKAARKEVPAGVCARVRLRIDQDAIVSRTAFTASLELENMGQNPLSQVGVTLDVRDSAHRSSVDLFEILAPQITGIAGANGTGVLPSGQAGSIRFTLIPLRVASTNGPTVYQIGGVLRYVEGEQEVVVPLFACPITVYPDANLVLKYFQQRDVYADDPFTEAVVEPSEPFALGLLVQNTGRGTARNFRITSAQPKIIENEKGLLIDFMIIGAQVGADEVTPSLALNLGTIEPGHSQVARWLMTSTLQGKFIEYSASFEHADELGGQRTSLIESTEIHELVHVVRDDRAGVDGLMDFLANDLPDPDNLPDTVHLSDGTLASVSSVTNGVADGVVTPALRQIHLTATLPAGWAYLKIPDPGPGYQLYRVVRSDGKEMRVGDNAWTTDRTFPAAQAGVRREYMLHMFDFNSTGSYTLHYRTDDSVPPLVVAIANPGLVTAHVASVDVTFSEVIDLATLTYADLMLTRNGGANLITSGVTISQVSDAVYRVNGLSEFTSADGNYAFTASATGVQDLGGNPGNNSLTVRWAKGTSKPVASAIEGVSGPHVNQPIGALDVVFTKPLDFDSLDFSDFTLTRDGGGNLLSDAVSIVALSPSRLRVIGLTNVTAIAGQYVFTVIGSGIQDTDGNGGEGLLTQEWAMVTIGPRIATLQTVRPDPRNFSVMMVEVAFAEAIHPATFDFRDLSLVRDGGPDLITSAVRVDKLDDRRFRISNLQDLMTADGGYRLSVSSAAVQDLAGNSGSDTANTSWVMDRTPPAAPSDLRVAPDGGIAPDDGLVNVTSLVLGGALTETNLIVTVTDELSGAYLGEISQAGPSFEIPIEMAAHGSRSLRIEATDAANNTSEAAVLDVFVDLVPPVATVASVTPSSRTDPVDQVHVLFSEPPNPATFDRTDLVLCRDGGPNLVNGQVRVQQLSGLQYVVAGLSNLTATPGQYGLTVNTTTVEDHAGNAGLGTAQVAWEILKPNTGPVLSPVLAQSVTVGSALVITNRASDPDVPPQVLTFSLPSGAPAGATLDSLSGVFCWTPTAGQAPSTNVIRVRVTDDGLPPLSDEITFTVIARSTASAPMITEQPACLVALAGTNATFAVTAQGSAPLRYQWAFNGVDLEGKTNALLSVTNVQPADSGGYRVRVANDFGSTNSALATLLVLSTNLPPDTVVYENMTNPQTGGWTTVNEFGDEVVLAASRTGWLLTRMELLVHVGNTANGNELARVRLYANDGPALPGAPGVATPGTLLYDSGFTLALARGTNAVRIADLSVYVHERLTWTVQFSGVNPGEAVGLLLYYPPEVGDSEDDYWEKTGAVWSLLGVPGSVANFGATLMGIQGIGSAPEIIVQPQDQRTELGGPAAFVVVAEGWPSPQYQWRRAGTNLVDRAGLAGTTGPVLALSAATESDAGTYDVVVTNLAGSARSEPATLTVTSEALVRLRLGTSMDNLLTLTVESSQGGQFVIQRSTDLSNWVPVAQAQVNQALTLDQIDPGGANWPQRFFRAKTAGGQDYVAPTITAPPANVVTNAGSTVTFTVLAAGTDPKSYQWRKGAVNLANAGNVSGATTATLTLSNVQTADAGSYTVVVTNIAGAATSAAATLTVNVAPTITTGPANVVTNVGSTVRFTVVAAGTDPKSYQWRKGAVNLANGGNVSGATTSTLTLSNVQTADAGSYTVVVTNVAGSVTSAAVTLTVNVAPTIATGPANVVTNAGSTVRFTVVAAGTDPKSYQWRNGAVNLANGGNVSGATTSTLTLSNVQTADAGSYTVVVANVAGSVTSAAATLTVNVAPTITTGPANVVTNVGSTVTFTVAAAGTDPKSYQWRKSGVDLTNGGNVSGATTATLTLSNVQTADAGSYTVVVTNVAGSVTSAAATLTVNVAPTITTGPANVVTNAGSTVRFTIVAAGTDPKSYQWRKGAVNLLNGGNVAGATTATLTLSNVQTADAGSYTVVVSNVAGSVTSAAAVLTVAGPNSYQTVYDSILPVEDRAMALSWLDTEFGNRVSLASNQRQRYLTRLEFGYANASKSSGTQSVTFRIYRHDNASGQPGALLWTSPRVYLPPGWGTGGVDVDSLLVGDNITWTAQLEGLAEGQFTGIQTKAGALIGTSQPGQAWFKFQGAWSLETGITGLDSAPAVFQLRLIAAQNNGTPFIVSHPSSTTVRPGESAAFGVQATGQGSLSYQWQFASRFLANDDRISGANEANLTISNAQTANAGTYLAWVANAYGYRTSRAAGLSVLPEPWMGQDIGDPTTTGFSKWDDDILTLSAGGSDIWGGCDEFHFAHRSVTNDVDLIVCVNSLQDTDPWAKAGLMIRESAHAGSPHAMVVVTPTNGICLQYRSSLGGDMDSVSDGTAYVAPCWLKLSRRGSTVHAYRSTSGASWVAVGSVTVPLSASALAGAVLTSHTPSASCTAVFSSLRVVPVSQEPIDMVLIPAGSFQMGDSFGEGNANERPVHAVSVSAFYVDKYEVTKALWDEVYTWAISHGYSFDNAGSGKAANHPVHNINWYDVVKWCNARSEREGRALAYYTTAAQTAPYRTGRIGVQNASVKWNAGYRLPTEAEWEKAARGGLSGKRFPWGDTISHSRADYYSSSSYSHDVSPTRGNHPTYATGAYPYTSPVGSFAPNGYGLYGMAGNVWEWCWDWYGGSYYASSPGSDPRGPASGSFRAFRGGVWDLDASYSRVSFRRDWPDTSYVNVGFRSVLPPGQ